MTDERQHPWDPDSLRQIRIVGDRRYRRRLGLASLLLLAGQGTVGAWFIDFSDRPVFFLTYWCVFLALFLVTIFIAVVDIWSVRLEFAVKRRDLAKELIHGARAAAAPRNGNPVHEDP